MNRLSPDDIHVQGWPRSGTTWLTRLLGDALNWPTGAMLPELDAAEIATEGLDRPGPGTIRKGHVNVTDFRALIPDERKVVLIVRDPRDVAVSASFYWEKSVEHFVKVLTTPAEHPVGRRWDDYVMGWHGYPNVVVVRYEDLLLLDTRAQVEHIFWVLGFKRGFYRIKDAVERQSFDCRLVWTKENLHSLKRGKSHFKFLREGKVGGWRDHFDTDMKQRINALAEAMEFFGYKVEQ